MPCPISDFPTTSVTESSLPIRTQASNGFGFGFSLEASCASATSSRKPTTRTAPVAPPALRNERRETPNPLRASGPFITHQDRKSTRLNSSHLGISYAVFCLKKKKQRI